MRPHFISADHQPVHPASKIGPVRLSNEMKMISHQDKGQHRDAIARPRALQQFRELRLISLIAEDFLPLIATDNAVVKLPERRWFIGRGDHGSRARSPGFPDQLEHLTGMSLRSETHG